MPFRFPFPYPTNYYNTYMNYNNYKIKAISNKPLNTEKASHNRDNNYSKSNSYKDEPKPEEKSKKNNSKSNSDENCFFELFGLKLYFDDIILICLLFFLYQEGVQDEELFIGLILLLLS